MNLSYLCGMGRIMSIDFGKKRTGLAVTDPLQIIVSPLTTVDTEQLMEFLQDYLLKEEVEQIVIGQPGEDGEGSHIENDIKELKEKIGKKFPGLSVVFHDENFTSKRAVEILVMTSKKKDRRKKENIDKVSAVLILQSYLNHI